MLETKTGCSPHLTQGGAVGGWRTGCSMAASDNMSLAQDKLRIGGAKMAAPRPQRFSPYRLALRQRLAHSELLARLWVFAGSYPSSVNPTRKVTW
jgi:hypothetical protein